MLIDACDKWSEIAGDRDQVPKLRSAEQLLVDSSGS